MESGGPTFLLSTRTFTAFYLLGKFLRGITGFPGGEEVAINPSLSSGECGVTLRVIVTPDVGSGYPTLSLLQHGERIAN